jgi:hypothetical protein
MMARLVAVAILFASGFAQVPTRESLLLPKPLHVSGIVIDQGGKPVAEASIGNADAAPTQLLQTDATGNFSFDSKAPFFVIRKAGFRSERVSTQGADNLKVALQSLNGPVPIQACTDDTLREGLDTFEGAFQFAKTDTIVATKPNMDVDYLSRKYYLKHARKSGVIYDGGGPIWGGGQPMDDDVWRSVQFEEVVYKTVKSDISDARGQFSDGKRWRNLGWFGESASYVGVDPETAKVFDRFLDSVCLRTTKRQSQQIAR